MGSPFHVTTHYKIDIALSYTVEVTHYMLCLRGSAWLSPKCQSLASFDNKTVNEDDRVLAQYNKSQSITSYIASMFHKLRTFRLGGRGINTTANTACTTTLLYVNLQIHDMCCVSKNVVFTTHMQDPRGQGPRESCSPAPPILYSRSPALTLLIIV